MIILILLIAAYCIGVAVEGFLRGIDAAQRDKMAEITYEEFKEARDE